MRRRATLVAAILSLGSSGCFTPKKQLVLPPPPPVVAKQPRIEAPPEIAVALPKIDIEPVTLPAKTTIKGPVAQGGATEENRTVRPPRPRPTTPVAPPTQEVDPPPTPAPPPVPVAPQLSEILTDDRTRQYQADIAAFVARARAVVKRASARRGLTARQTEAVQRINTFLQQAEESKAKDLVTAHELARRADLLGQDLLRSLP
jgi:hypothetical protein